MVVVSIVLVGLTIVFVTVGLDTDLMAVAGLDTSFLGVETVASWVLEEVLSPPLAAIT